MQRSRRVGEGLSFSLKKRRVRTGECKRDYIRHEEESKCLYDIRLIRGREKKDRPKGRVEKVGKEVR